MEHLNKAVIFEDYANNYEQYVDDEVMELITSYECAKEWEDLRWEAYYQ